MTARFGSLPFKEQIEFLQNKIPVPTRGWADIYGAEHDRAYIVAGITRMDVLADLKAATVAAAADGEGLAAFRKRLRQSQAEKGWAFPGDFNRRSRLIYQTNMRSSYGAGREAQMADPALRARLPFKLYRHGGSRDPRPQHLAWNGLVLRADDPWWDTHSPPNGWGCRCKAFLVNQRTMDRLGLRLGDAPPLELRDVTVGQQSGNPRTVSVPKGIDPSFEHRPGATALGELARLYLDRATGLPAAQGAVAVLGALSRERVLEALQSDYVQWFDQVRADPLPRGRVMTVGALSPTLVETLTARGVVPESALIALRDADVIHMFRPNKAGQLDAAWFARLPTHLRTPKAVILERPDTALFVYDDPQNPGGAMRLVIQVNYELRTRTADGERQTVRVNVVKSGRRVSVDDLMTSAGELIDGSL
ncbi:MAG: phage head morphogenesis protein [Panacagrimonas sp.]